MKQKPSKFFNQSQQEQNTKSTNPKSKQYKYLLISVKRGENACEQVTIGFGFISDWLRK